MCVRRCFHRWDDLGWAGLVKISHFAVYITHTSMNIARGAISKHQKPNNYKAATTTIGVIKISAKYAAVINNTNTKASAKLILFAYLVDSGA